MAINDTDQRHAMLAAIIDSSDDAIISKTLGGIITSWNKAAEEMFGYTAGEITGQHIYLLIPEDRRSEEDIIISQLRQGKRIEHFQTVRLTKSGKSLDISLTISPIVDAKGTIIGASKIARDITRQKETEELLKKYSERLELINATSRAIAGESDIEIILQKVTDATTKLSGAAFGAFFYNKTDADGETYMLYALSGAPREAFEKFGMPRNTDVFRKTFSGEGILRSDDITKDTRYGKNAPHHGMPKGHLPVVSYLAVPVISPSRVVIGGLFFGHPEPAKFNAEHESAVGAIAGQAATVLEKVKLYEEVQALSAKKDEFIGFANHELKTPLSTIIGYLQLAEQLPERAAEFLPRISKQVDRLSGIVADLLDISNMQTGKLNLNISTTSLQVLIRESIETVRTLSANHSIQSEVPPDDIFIIIDSQKIGQVIINILTNAIKYSPEHSKIVVSAMQLGNRIQISIRDQGVGIAPQHLSNIFNRFYRISKSSHRAPGLGLGLYLSKEIIEAHHGRIWAESEENKGSTFYIDFPVEK